MMVSEIEGEIKAILNHYRLGRLVSFERNERGFVNTSFALETEMNGARRKYFLRRYKRGTSEDEIKFEHSILQHLLAKDFKWVAPVIAAASGETYVRHRLAEGIAEDYYAIFEFLSGEDRYTWFDPHCSQQEIAAAANVLAQFHQAVRDLKPQDRKSEAKIFDLLATLQGNLAVSSSLGSDAQVENYLHENATCILDHVGRTLSALQETQCQDCPQIVIHCDFHPGNLQFTGSQVSALFDFDWSKIDLRSFDLGLALFYFFASWKEADGRLRLEGIRLFLDSYQSTLSAGDGVGALTRAELRCLPAMVQAGNLYVLNWALLDYANKAINPAEYLVYIRHCVNTIRWLEQVGNQASLVSLVGGLMKEIDG